MTSLVTHTHTHTHTNTGLTLILPGDPGLAGFLLDSPSSYIHFKTILPCPSQTGEGTTVKEEEWRESHFVSGKSCRVFMA